MSMHLLTSRRIPNKLFWISLSFSLPICVLLYFTIAGINNDIRFTERELAGNEYQNPLHELLRHLPRHQWLAGRAAASESDLLAEQSKIDLAFQRLDAVQRTLGDELQVTEDGLARRNRAGTHPRNWLRRGRNSRPTCRRSVRSRVRRDTVNYARPCGSWSRTSETRRI